MSGFGYEHERTIEDDIHDDLDSGYENNPEIATWTSSDLTRDLMAYSITVENMDYEEIKPYVESWLVAFAGRP